MKEHLHPPFNWRCNWKSFGWRTSGAGRAFSQYVARHESMLIYHIIFFFLASKNCVGRSDHLPKEFCSWDYPRCWSVCAIFRSFLDAAPCLCLHDDENKTIIGYLFIVLYKHSTKSPSAFLSELVIHNSLLMFCCWKFADLMVHSGGSFLIKSWPGSLDLNPLSKIDTLLSVPRCLLILKTPASTQIFFPDSRETK